VDTNSDNGCVLIMQQFGSIANPKSFALIEAAGTRCPDRGRKRPGVARFTPDASQSDGLYVLCHGTDLSIKRIQLQPDGRLIIRSDNPYQSAQLLPRVSPCWAV
jgi:hypothetical protein